MLDISAVLPEPSTRLTSSFPLELFSTGPSFTCSEVSCSSSSSRTAPGPSEVWVTGSHSVGVRRRRRMKISSCENTLILSIFHLCSRGADTWSGVMSQRPSELKPSQRSALIQRDRPQCSHTSIWESVLDQRSTCSLRLKQPDQFLRGPPWGPWPRNGSVKNSNQNQPKLQASGPVYTTAL